MNHIAQEQPVCQENKQPEVENGPLRWVKSEVIEDIIYNKHQKGNYFKSKGNIKNTQSVPQIWSQKAMIDSLRKVIQIALKRIFELMMG